MIIYVLKVIIHPTIKISLFTLPCFIPNFHLIFTAFLIKCLGEHKIQTQTFEQQY